MSFQASDTKGWHFLELLNDNLNSIELLYAKGGPWLKHFGHSNLLCARASRVVINYASIGEYHLRFFPKKDFKCLCSLYFIELRKHILHNCMRYNNY